MKSLKVVPVEREKDCLPQSVLLSLDSAGHSGSVGGDLQQLHRREGLEAEEDGDEVDGEGAATGDRGPSRMEAELFSPEPEPEDEDKSRTRKERRKPRDKGQRHAGASAPPKAKDSGSSAVSRKQQQGETRKADSEAVTTRSHLWTPFQWRPHFHGLNYSGIVRMLHGPKEGIASGASN